jgi:hypothetical protein
VTPVRAAVAIVSLSLAAPGVAAAATIKPDPERSCYRETERVFLLA